MGVIQEFFNNREIAIGIWVIIGLAVILPTKPARQFIKTAIPILFCKKFVIFYIVFLSFLGLVLFALNWAGLWDLTLLKDTVFWVLFVELPLFAKAIEKADGGRFFSNLIRENVAIVVAIEFFVGFWTFSLITEIILIPLTVLISVLQVLAGQDKKHRSAKRFFDGLLVLWGIILLINAIYSLIHAPNQFLSFDTLKSLLLPLVLLVFNLPVVYGLALYNTYEQIFIRIKGSKSEQKKMKWQVIRFSGINLSKVSAIRKSLPNTIVCCRTSNDLQINLKKLARRLDLQIGENYMKRSRYYVLACIAGLILSFIGLIGANSDVSLKDLVTLNFVFDIPRIKEILTNIFSTMIVFSATLFFFAIGFAKKQREDVSQIRKYALYELLLSVKMQHSQLVDYPPIDEPADLFCAYVHNVYGKQPIEDGIDVVAVDSLAFQRYCELASLISKPLTVVTDNDGNAEAVRKRYEKYTGLVTLCVESDNTLNTLEPSVLAANLDTFESFKSIIYLGKDIESRDPDSIKSFMIGNKTDWSMRVFTSEKKINYPSYILKAIGIDSENVGDRDE